MPPRPRSVLSLSALCGVFLASSPAWATWSSFEYRNADGAYRYGIKDGSSKVRLGLSKRKDADKTATAMNKAEALDESGANSSREEAPERGKNK